MKKIILILALLFFVFDSNAYWKITRDAKRKLFNSVKEEHEREINTLICSGKGFIEGSWHSSNNKIGIGNLTYRDLDKLLEISDKKFKKNKLL